uniref:Rho-GAP domain-containing protein n=1 Tax=Cynoglossus semilaevis TaxID=244447 RepID=A0A3P8WYE4_CYNSE
MKNKGTKQKLKKKGSDNAFGCDLIEHLQSSGQDVPQVLKKCAEFIEKHGIVDGIYRLSGVTSNIQRLRYLKKKKKKSSQTLKMFTTNDRVPCVKSLDRVDEKCLRQTTACLFSHVESEETCRSDLFLFFL